MHVERQAFFKGRRVVIADGLTKVREFPSLVVELRQIRMIQRPGIQHRPDGRTTFSLNVDVDVTLGVELAAFRVNPGKECRTTFLENVVRRRRRSPRPRHGDVERRVLTGTDVGGIRRLGAVFARIGFQNNADARSRRFATVLRTCYRIRFGVGRNVDRLTRERDGGVTFEMKYVGGTCLSALHRRFEGRRIGAEAHERCVSRMEGAVKIPSFTVNQQSGTGVVRILIGLSIAVDGRHRNCC